MTTYFDDKRKQLSKIADFDYAALRKFDEGVVWDVTLAAESPGMPSDMRDAIHHIVLKRSLACQPFMPNGTFRAGPDPEYMSDHRRMLNDLVGDLHTIFHQIATLGLEGFSDSPIRPLRHLYDNGEDRRIELAVVASTASASEKEQEV